MVRLQKRQTLAFGFGINIEKSEAVCIYYFIRLFHGSVFEWLLGFAAFAGSNAVAETLVDLKHVGEGIVAAFLEFEEERGARVHGVMRSNEEVSHGSNRPVFLSQHPQTWDCQVGSSE